jgi:uncharacterized protein (TIGR02300 family)
LTFTAALEIKARFTLSCEGRMPAKDLGTKHVCYKCGTKFYDLRKPEPICPKCGADQRESPAVKAPPAAEKRQRAAARPVAPAPEVEEAESVEADLDDDAEDADDADEADDAEDEP